jgi:hypothetical protein
MALNTNDGDIWPAGLKSDGKKCTHHHSIIMQRHGRVKVTFRVIPITYANVVVSRSESLGFQRPPRPTTLRCIQHHKHFEFGTGRYMVFPTP